MPSAPPGGHEAKRNRPRSVVICHHDEPLSRLGLPRWLSTWSDVVLVIVVREPTARLKQRVRREIKRVGPLRFLDVLAFRLYYRLVLAGADARAEQQTLEHLLRQYPEIPSSTRVVEVTSPNSTDVEALLRELQPTFMIARCRTILRKDVFMAPTQGTYVMHPGICPEYRNAHGCFWALANRDRGRVGMTLLRVDAGVDTGAVFGYFTYPFDEAQESHNTIQDRVVFDNLDAIRETLQRVLAGEASPIETTGRLSRTWGQPWMTRYVSWKRAARAGGR
jgi:folate-dependent phosphoribosylglycinamide formyltransferase PurN